MSPHEPAAIVPALAPEVAGRVRVGLIRAEPIAVGPASPGLDAEIEALRAELAAAHAGRAPGAIEALAPARELYRTHGVDPTRTRPSSESLLRRVLQGKPLPMILNAVDVCTLCSLRFLLPIGLYDAGRIRGTVTLRLGLPRESYAGIRKDDVHLDGRLVLADADGAFGNPTSDSLRTSVTEATASVWMVIFAPAGYAVQDLDRHVAFARAALARHVAPASTQTATSGLVLA